jgi:nickel-dependent lactate racemase
MPQDGILFARGSALDSLSDGELRKGLFEALDTLGPRKRVLALPPDGYRAHSRAGILLKAVFDYYGEQLCAVMPALGTHKPMSAADLTRHYPGIPLSLFRSHDWRNEITELGRVPADFVKTASDGLCSFELTMEVNRLVVEGGFDLILSIGQVVPHEVAGMANYTENLFVGVGGKDGIDRTHWLGAAYGIERVLGRIDTPVRKVLDYAQEHIAASLPIAYALTVVETEAPGNDAPGDDVVRGLYVGTGRKTFESAARLAAEVNVEYVDHPIRKAVVWLDPKEYRSTWHGNKAIHRIRLAVGNGGELIIMAPGVDCFGEERSVDETIRDYGYCGTPAIRELVESGELAGDLPGAAHLASGSTEGRFQVRYAPGGLRRQEIEDVGYAWADCQSMTSQYNPASLRDGWNTVAGEEIYFIRNPALGLWAVQGALKKC